LTVTPASAPAAVVVKAAAVTNQTTVKVQSKTYYLDVIGSGTNASVWFRVKPNTCSAGDIKIADVAAKVATKSQALSNICSKKNFFDNMQVVAGCGSVVGVGVCYAAGLGLSFVAGPEIGIPFAYGCTVTLTAYARATGMKGCMMGVVEIAAKQFTSNKNVQGALAMAHASNGEGIEAFSRAFNYAFC
jgi:hypothetical protein